MDKIYKSLADKNRRMILSMLKDGPKSVNQILMNLSIGQATLSSHLSVLRKAGMVKSLVLGKQRIYRLSTDVLYFLQRDIEQMLKKNDDVIGDEIILRRKVV